jgi:hypothetical protein
VETVSLVYPNRGDELLQNSCKSPLPYWSIELLVNRITGQSSFCQCRRISRSMVRLQVGDSDRNL